MIHCLWAEPLARLRLEVRLNLYGCDLHEWQAREIGADDVLANGSSRPSGVASKWARFPVGEHYRPERVPPKNRPSCAMWPTSRPCIWLSSPCSFLYSYRKPLARLTILDPSMALLSLCCSGFRLTHCSCG